MGQDILRLEGADYTPLYRIWLLHRQRTLEQYTDWSLARPGQYCKAYGPVASEAMDDPL